MKKQIGILFAALLLPFMLDGCSKLPDPVPEISEAVEDIMPSMTIPETAATETQEPSAHTISPDQEESISATIEDGNGPIPSQNPE